LNRTLDRPPANENPRVSGARTGPASSLVYPMLDAIRAFVSRTIAPAAAPDAAAPRHTGVQVAAAALLLEIAHADGEFSDAERAHIERALGRHLGLDEPTTRELLELAEVERRQSIDHFQFTRLMPTSMTSGRRWCWPR
jgi:uncharacterized tellurite resistance protein B-like protein